MERGLEGLEEVEVWIHTCWGNPNMQRGVDDSSYANSIEIYLERMNAATSGRSRRRSDGFMDLELLPPVASRMPKKIAIGVVSHRTLQVESAEEVADYTRRALERFDAEKLS